MYREQLVWQGYYFIISLASTYRLIIVWCFALATAFWHFSWANLPPVWLTLAVINCYAWSVELLHKNRLPHRQHNPTFASLSSSGNFSSSSGLWQYFCTWWVMCLPDSSSLKTRALMAPPTGACTACSWLPLKAMFSLRTQGILFCFRRSLQSHCTAMRGRLNC